MNIVVSNDLVVIFLLLNALDDLGLIFQSNA